uniref:(northern house mosquito) hypothetical protein n=1 Tax=Culex pipiens TaxID=7175 RepID=A0A8D8FGC2_CULPI
MRTSLRCLNMAIHRIQRSFSLSGIFWSHSVFARHTSWIRILPWMMKKQSNPAGSKSDITIRSACRFVGRSASNVSVIVKVKTSSSGFQYIPSTRSIGLFLSNCMHFSRAGSFSPTRARTSLEFDSQFRRSKPPRECTCFTSNASFVASSTESALSR